MNDNKRPAGGYQQANGDRCFAAYDSSMRIQHPRDQHYPHWWRIRPAARLESTLNWAGNGHAQRWSRLGLLIALLPVYLLVAATQPVAAYSDTHYGYYNWLNWELPAGSGNTCAIVAVRSTAVGVNLWEDPVNVANCLKLHPDITTVIAKPENNSIFRQDFVDEMTHVYSGQTCVGSTCLGNIWSNMPKLFPGVNFVVEVGNEPDLDFPSLGPWQVGYYQNDTITFMQATYGAGRPNLYYAAALGTGQPTVCRVDGSDGHSYCGLDYVATQVSGQHVCTTGWGCSLHSYWDTLSGGYSSGPSFWRNLVNYVQGSADVPRAVVTEQGINANGTSSPYIADEDCHLRQYTYGSPSDYPSKIRVALTFIVAVNQPGVTFNTPTYQIDQLSDICPSP